MPSGVVTVRFAPAGASFTDWTAMLAVSVVLLNAVVPPFVVASPVPPADPDDWSHARYVSPLTAPLKFAFGTNRTRVLASDASKRAAAAPGAPKASHAPPPLSEYCHAPFVLSTETTAMPDCGLLSASDTCPAIRADTSVPAFAPASSRTPARSLVPESTGALLGASNAPMSVAVS